MSAAKLSAVVSKIEFLAGDSDELDWLLATESEDGERERLKCIGLGAGIGGLLAIGPVGRSMTRSGAWAGGFWVLGVVFDFQKSLFPRKPDCTSSSLFVEEFIDLLSQRSFLLIKLELLLSSGDSSFKPNLLPQLDCFNKIPSWSPGTGLLVRGVAVGARGLAPSMWSLFRGSPPVFENFLPTPCLDPAGRLASSTTISASSLTAFSFSPTTSSTTAFTHASVFSNSLFSFSFEPVLTRLS